MAVVCFESLFYYFDKTGDKIVAFFPERSYPYSHRTSWSSSRQRLLGTVLFRAWYSS